jgi:hypothetical protein
MQLLVCACIAWVTIILFAIIPKRLSILDFVFLYCIVLSLTSTSFTILELNYHIIKIPSLGTDLWAVTVFHVITAPLLILMAMNALQPSEERKPQWIMVFAIWIELTTHDWALYRFKVIHYHLSYSWPLIGLAYLGLIIITWGLILWYKRFDHKKVGQI